VQQLFLRADKGVRAPQALPKGSSQCSWHSGPVSQRCDTRAKRGHCLGHKQPRRFKATIQAAALTPIQKSPTHPVTGCCAWQTRWSAAAKGGDSGSPKQQTGWCRAVARELMMKGFTWLWSLSVPLESGQPVGLVKALHSTTDLVLESTKTESVPQIHHLSSCVVWWYRW